MVKYFKRSSNINDNNSRIKINRLLAQNNYPTIISTKAYLLRNLNNYIADAYSESDKQDRIKDAENVKNDSYNFYIIEEDGHFEGFTTLDDAIKQIINDFKEFFADEPDKVKKFMIKINNILEK